MKFVSKRNKARGGKLRIWLLLTYEESTNISKFSLMTGLYLALASSQQGALFCYFMPRNPPKYGIT